MKISTLIWEKVRVVPIKSMQKKKLTTPQNWESCSVIFDPAQKSLVLRQYKDNWSTGKSLYLINPELIMLNGWCAEFIAYTWRSYFPIVTKDKSCIYNEKYANKLFLVEKVKVTAEF